MDRYGPMVGHPMGPDPTPGGQSGKFCYWCGLPLIERRVLSGYHSRTGAPLYEKRRDCPRVLGRVR